jgi:prenylcysteine oxidase/farnesylcysteine lyase
LAAEGAVAVEGGNWQIFDGMAQRSGATIALNTTVVGLQKSQDTVSSRPLYTVSTTSSSTSGTTAAYPVAFDNVIIANPFQFSGISAAEGVLQTSIDEIPYVQLHVTIFSSASWFKPQFFSLPKSSKPPGMVLTTLANNDSPSSGVDGVGKAGFFSLSNLGKATNPQTQQQEYVYKIFSLEKVTPKFLRSVFVHHIPCSQAARLTRLLLSGLLGAMVPETFTGESSPISWYYPHVFHSYPKAYPRVTFQDPIVGEGVYYTSGMESFISTMETNALMGKNVARLIVDDILAASSDGESVKARDDGPWEDKQDVLN